MSITKSKKKAQAKNDNNGGWDGAIKDAKRKIQELRRSIKLLTISRDRGDVWPGQQP